MLYSWRGFLFTDLLLAQPERDTWRACWHSGNPSSHFKSLDGVEWRARKSLQIGERENILLDIGLGHLTLGKTALYAAVLRTESLSPDAPAWAEDGHIAAELLQAVDSLRSGSQQRYVPLALLTRAWLRHLQGRATGPDSAQTDLDEAWEVAERGPMPLHMTDIHLHRARLFFRDAHYPWNTNDDNTPRGPLDDLREARRLIEKHGYWRRKEELEDAEEALNQWLTNTPAQQNQHPNRAILNASSPPDL